MPTLFGSYRSRASRNLWLAEEAGIALDLHLVWQANRLDDPEADGAPLNTRSPEFLRLSPLGAVPVLTDGELTLTESLAINLHLARGHGGELGPRDGAEDALMTQWALFGAASVEAPALAIQNATKEGEPDDEGRAMVAEAVGRLDRPLGALEKHLAREGNMVGGRFTVADVNVAEIVRYAQAHAGIMAAHPGIDAWLRHCQARPAFLRMWERREAEPLRP